VDLKFKTEDNAEPEAEDAAKDKTEPEAEVAEVAVEATEDVTDADEGEKVVAESLSAKHHQEPEEEEVEEEKYDFTLLDQLI